MESTSDYWKGVYYLLEAEGFRVLAGQRPGRQERAGPGRRPTGPTRCGWRRWPSGACAGRRWCTRRRSGGCATSPATGARLVQDRTREQQRVEKLLEDAQIKISSVLSDIFTGSRAGR